MSTNKTSAGRVSQTRAEAGVVDGAVRAPLSRVALPGAAGGLTPMGAPPWLGITGVVLITSAVIFLECGYRP